MENIDSDNELDLGSDDGTDFYPFELDDDDMGEVADVESEGEATADTSAGTPAETTAYADQPTVDVLIESPSEQSTSEQTTQAAPMKR